jgi:hypothetical protein
VHGIADATTAADWREYVTARFSDADQFLVRQFADSTFVSDRTGRSATEIDFRYLPGTASELWGIYCFNSRTPLWNARQNRECLWCHLEPEEQVFSKENVQALELDLELPLRSGWTERLYYYRGRHVKSRLSWVSAGSAVEVTEYADAPGCLMSLVLSLRYSTLVVGSQMRTETVVVGPMEGAA